MKLFGYWYDNNMSDTLKKSIEETKKNNPYLDYEIYNNTMARDFLKNNFEPRILETYDILIPKSFKSDLLRFCLIYIYGGMYIDCKFILNSVPKSLFENNDYLLTYDYKRRKYDFKPMITGFFYFKKAGNPNLLKCIEEIVNNVKNKNKTSHVLLITGPLLFGKNLQNIIPNMKCKIQRKPELKFIIKYKKTILINNSLKQYYDMKTHESYWELWKKKSVDYIFKKV